MIFSTKNLMKFNRFCKKDNDLTIFVEIYLYYLIFCPTFVQIFEIIG